MPFLVGGSHGISVPIGRGRRKLNFEAAPDGNIYYAVLGPSLHLLRGMELLDRAKRNYLRMPKGAGRAQAVAIEVVEREVRTAVTRSGLQTAAFAQQRAQELLDKRIVRPATPSAPHLRDAIVARAVATRIPGGAVGIGDISRLDAHPYWKAQEFGSQHLVGKTVRGFFFDSGGARHAPDPAQFREHPIFKPGAGPKMVIENPIEGKGFLAEAVLDALGYRYRIWRTIEAAAVAQMTVIGTGRPPTSQRLRRYGGRIGGFPRRP